MTPSRPASSIFLVERYLPVTTLEELAAAVSRVALACAARRGSGVDLHYLHATFIPAEDTCFCVFKAPSAETVLAVNEAAHFGLDRISSGVGLDTRSSVAPDPPTLPALK
jgi:Protein of unknown function (DUF4242)